MNNDPANDREAMAARDAADPLAAFRDRFELPHGVVYLDGNSLGALPKATAGRLEKTVRAEWGHDLIRSWNTHGWMAMPRRVGDKIARLIGAAPGEVVAADSTSVNLFKLLAAALALRPERSVIVTEDDNFPTDVYVAQGLAALLGGHHQLRCVGGADVLQAIDEEVAVVLLTHVHYKTGRQHDMAAITAAAHAAGALVLWDLSHSAGALPLDLNAAGADLAVGCGYKYLNGGPGAPAFLFIARALQDEVRPPLSGWMGHAAPFAFEQDYRPAGGIERQLCGTPSILGMVALEAGVDLMLEADMGELRRKSLALSELFIDLISARCPELQVVAAPAALRGSQVCLRHDQGYAIMQALIAKGVIGDFRAPDLMRFGFTPLYTRFVDVWDAVARLDGLMQRGDWDRPEFHHRAKVT